MAALSSAAARAERSEIRQEAPVDSRPAPSGVPICHIRDLRKSYSSDAIVLDGVNLTIGRGESVALIGANGTGKSTLLRCLVRLVEPDGGEINLLDRSVLRLGNRPLRQLRSRVGFVFQRHNLVARSSVLSNVIHGAQSRSANPRLWHQSLAPAAIRTEAMACLERVGLTHLAGRRADQLSGGQSQRVAVARTLMQRPEFVIADEPVASLDPSAGLEVMQLFTQLLREDGVTLMFTSHQLEQAIAFSDRIVGLRNGTVHIDRVSAHTQVSDLTGIYD